MFDVSLITENRLSSALKKELTPLQIDRESSAAIFSGSGGKAYDTTLDHCSCPDFAIQGFSQPCKHMIRLAMEVNKIPSDGMQTDIDAARGKYLSGKAKEIAKYAPIEVFVPFTINFFRLAVYDVPVKDNVFSDSLGVATVSDIPFLKVKKDGSASVKKEWKKEVENILTALATRFGTEMIGYAINDKSFMDMIYKEGE